MIKSVAVFLVAAFCEIFGCYTVWMWLRRGGTPLWLIPGAASLAVFALTLTLIDTPFAGRAFAAYGGIYIVCALVWLRLVERRAPDLTDLAGVALCLLGAALILSGPRAPGG